MTFNLTFHHLGLAVRKAQPARAFLEGLGYKVTREVFDPNQNVHLAMCEHEDQPSVEIIYPGEDKSPVDGLVARHPDGIIYHPCYVTDDLERMLADFEEVKLRAICVSPPKPAVLFGGAPVSFYQVTGIGLIEIIEAPIRAIT
jgi:catechol 2,3-dioxygenase-like lactoylglutathione lyase family enzyme